MEYGKYMLLIYLAAGTVRTCNYIMNTCYRAGGEAIFGTVLEIICLYTISVPATWVAGMVLHLPFLAVFAFLYTDELIRMAHDMDDKPPKREMDMLFTIGEQMSVALMAMAMDSMGVPAVSLNAFQVAMHTTSAHGSARLKKIDAARIRRELDNRRIVVVTGFQGIDKYNDYTTLGRGGSDTTAVALAAALHADACEIYTDVDGVYTCDPRVVKDAKKIQTLSYDEMLEMASNGSKVMQSRSVEFAKKFGVVFEVRNSMNNNPGTIVQEETPSMEAVVIRGISIDRNQARVTITGIPDQIGYTAQILGALAEAEINLDMILANTAHDGYVRQSFTMPSNELGRAQAALKPVMAALGSTVKVETEAGLAKLSLVGIGMRSHSGVGATAFKALADANIKTGMISTSEIKIAVMVDESDIEEAARVVHKAFNLGA